MIKYLSNIIAYIKGFFIQASEEVLTSSTAGIKSTYAIAIRQAKNDYTTLIDAVGELAAQRKRAELQLNALYIKENNLRHNLEGALLKSRSEPEVEAHKEAGIKFIEALKKLRPLIIKLEETIAYYDKLLEKNKSDICKSRSMIEDLRQEEMQVLVEFITTKQTLNYADSTQASSSDTHIAAIANIKDKIEAMKAKTSILIDNVPESNAYTKEGMNLESREIFNKLIEKMDETNESACAIVKQNNLLLS